MDLILPLFSIILINILLSGDNALVIALASRNLPEHQQRAAILWGGAGAIGLRIIFVFVATALLQIPYLQLIGGILLLWIALKLVSDDHQGTENIEASANLWGAVKTIIVADVVMSLDNVIAIVGVAKGNYLLLIIGLAISIPIIIWGSKLILYFIERWPIIITIGAAFLGWVGGEMFVSESHIAHYLEVYPALHWGIPTLFAIIVLVIEYRNKIKRKQAI